MRYNIAERFIKSLKHSNYMEEKYKPIAQDYSLKNETILYGQAVTTLIKKRAFPKEKELYLIALDLNKQNKRGQN